MATELTLFTIFRIVFGLFILATQTRMVISPKSFIKALLAASGLNLATIMIS